MKKLNSFMQWLLFAILIAIPLSLIIMRAFGKEAFITFMDGDSIPLIQMSSKMPSDSASVKLLSDMKDAGLLITPEDYTNHTYNFFSWLLTIFVAVVSIVLLVFGINISQRVNSEVDRQLKEKMMELLMNDKAVDNMIGGLVDEKIGETVEEISQEIHELHESVKDINSSALFISPDGQENN